MRNERLWHFLMAGLCLVALACGGSEKKETLPSLPNCPATTGACSFTWSGASSGTDSCTASVTLQAPNYWGDLRLADASPPITYPSASARFEIKAAPSAGTIIRTGDLYLPTPMDSSVVLVVERLELGWVMWRDGATVGDKGDFALYVDSVNGTELHGHLSAYLENMEGAPGTVVSLCATF